jgi:hypothetical protein
MAHSIVRRPFTTEARVVTLFSPREICGGQIHSSTALPHVHSVSPPITIPQVLHPHLHLHAALIKRTNTRSLGTFQNTLCLNRIALDRNVRPWYCCTLYDSIGLPGGVSKQDGVTFLFQYMYRVSFVILYYDQKMHNYF